MSYPTLSDQVLRRLPALLEASRRAAQENATSRRALLEKIGAAEREFASADSAVAAKAKPLEERLAALRAETERIVRELAPLQAARENAASARVMALVDLRAQLRSIVQADLAEFQRSIDSMRFEISGNVNGRRERILRMFQPDRPLHHRIAEAMTVTLDAFREAQRAALEEEDFAEALQRIRQGVEATGIEFPED